MLRSSGATSCLQAAFLRKPGHSSRVMEPLAYGRSIGQIIPTGLQ